MSILNRADAEPTPAFRAAKQIVNQTKNNYNSFVSAFNDGSQNFWQNPRATPQEIAVELGTDAKEVFELHYAMGQFIATINPDAIAPGLGVIGQFNINEDGTVTITS